MPAIKTRDNTAIYIRTGGRDSPSSSATDGH